MTPLERAADAVQDAILALPAIASVEIQGDAQALYGRIARAVLQAIREPSEGMCAAGYNAGNWHDTVPLEGDGSLDATPVWRAMIDAALEE